ncbi:unnamed protein product [Arabidopsis thaliana]|uniref:Methylesterase n=1 Tax=Arabidopsis thaliana TaxID=3702 RepID=A0A5S9X0R5_ARATH|nr:unnamed protein product [Arabidopsis thaliana]
MYENGISFIISLLICGCVKSEEMMKQHFVLVHGSCLGAWCWYKVKPLLEASGHRVTALDLAACGIDTRSITDISTCEQYSEPLIQLMTSLPNDEKVVLVGHSYGGLTLAIAMDKFPDKISVSVFVTSFMPDTKNSPSFVLEKFASTMTPEDWMGSELEPYVVFSAEFTKHRILQLSPIEDLELRLLLKRPGSLFLNDLSRMKNFSEKGYGSVPRAYIVSKDDHNISEEYQRWMIDNYPPNLVIEMEGTDHLPLFCKPQLLSDHLLAIADKFS